MHDQKEGFVARVRPHIEFEALKRLAELLWLVAIAPLTGAAITTYFAHLSRRMSAGEQVVFFAIVAVSLFVGVAGVVWGVAVTRRSAIMRDRGGNLSSDASGNAHVTARTVR